MKQRGRSGLSLSCLVGICVALAAPLASAQQHPNLAGSWDSNVGRTYTISQQGTQFVWVEGSGATGTVTITPQGLSAAWSDAMGPQTASGTIVENDTAGRPTKIAWNNGVVFMRVASSSGIAPPQGQMMTGTIMGTVTLPSQSSQPSIPQNPFFDIAGLISESELMLLRLGPSPAFPSGLRSWVASFVFGTDAATARDREDPSLAAGPGDIVLVRRPDQNSPSLLQAFGVGAVVDKANVEAYIHRNGEPILVFGLTLETVRITGYRLVRSGSVATAATPSLNEEVRLSFGRVTVMVRTISETGELTPPQIGTWTPKK